MIISLLYLIIQFLERDWPQTIILNSKNSGILLESMNYPSHYPRMHQSQVTINTEEDKRIVIEWNHFILEQESNCSFDHVVISEEVLDYNIFIREEKINTPKKLG